MLRVYFVIMHSVDTTLHTFIATFRQWYVQCYVYVLVCSYWKASHNWKAIDALALDLMHCSDGHEYMSNDM